MQRTLVRPLLGALALALPLASPALADGTGDDLRGEIEALKQGQQQIRRQISELEKLLKSSAAPPPPAGPKVEGKVFDLGANPVKGAASAKLTLIEFTDYQ